MTFLQLKNNFECFVTEISVNFQSECDFLKKYIIFDLIF